MEFNEYQKEAHKTAVYKKNRTMTVYHVGAIGTIKVPLYPFIKVGAEANEIPDKVAKVIFRGDNQGRLYNNELEKEIGDILWYCAEMATQLGVSLEYIAIQNIHKLSERAKQNKIKGSGDNR